MSPNVFDCINNLFLFTASDMHIKGSGNRRGGWSGQRITAVEMKTETRRHSPNTMTENLRRTLLWNGASLPASARKRVRSPRGEACFLSATPITSPRVGGITRHRPPRRSGHPHRPFRGDVTCASCLVRDKNGLLPVKRYRNQLRFLAMSRDTTGFYCTAQLLTADCTL